MWEHGLDQSGSGQGQVVGTCKCCNEPSGSINCGEFLDQLKTGQLLLMMDSGLVQNMQSTLSNKSEKQCISLAFTIRIHYNARSSECQIGFCYFMLQMKASREKEHNNTLKGQPMHFSVMDIKLLHSGHQHALATHVAIFRVVKTRIQISLIMRLNTPQFKNHVVFG